MAQAPPSPETDVVSRQIESIVLAKIAADKLVIPPMPEVAMQCLTLLRDPNLQIKQLVAPLERDPPLTAGVLRLANSAAYGGGGSVQSIEQAVSRLGNQKIKVLLVEASASRMFQSRDRRIVEANAGVWEHSMAVALLARDLCALTSEGDAEGAYLAGLLHDVGKPIVAAILLEAEKQLTARSPSPWFSSDTWIRVVQNTHRPVGLALAEAWKLPEVVQSAIRDCSDFDSANRKSVGNFVRFANALSKTLGLYVGPVDVDGAAALVTIGRSLLELDDEIVARLSADLRERVQRQQS
jgi:putative nucleotidyltransferase with HDIG domain